MGLDKDGPNIVNIMTPSALLFCLSIKIYYIRINLKETDTWYSKTHSSIVTTEGKLYWQNILVLLLVMAPNYLYLIATTYIIEWA